MLLFIFILQIFANTFRIYLTIFAKFQIGVKWSNDVAKCYLKETICQLLIKRNNAFAKYTHTHTRTFEKYTPAAWRRRHTHRHILHLLRKHVCIKMQRLGGHTHTRTHSKATHQHEVNTRTHPRTQFTRHTCSRQQAKKNHTLFERKFEHYITQPV